MWLLSSRTWELKEFISHKQAPRYAILSHTWGEDEVLFRDLESNDLSKFKTKHGFDKVNGCRQQAAADGFEWIWVDTCCIDKRSSAELSEAINSMFQWYKSADICYAYLFDVSDDIESNLARCRWVKRGWTLQELIAPREVVFYSSDWQRLGARSTHSALLADITGINERFLRGESVYKASIAQRMSWAAKRETSREEDVAYCLLGMFDVNMPLIYGEGLKAFQRLQEILVREYPQDHTLFAWGKIVEKPSNCIEDKEQIWGSKPIQHQPNQVDQKWSGLLADSPEDFKDSGRFVAAPNAAGYFQGTRVISVNLIGHNDVELNLPGVGTPHYWANHLKRPAVGK
ncbi:heterokaryon incompatibility protein-domain-containing protein [Nemania sp. FL0031]|nr:heterokaryon incompatibility protein-domain-containing protein [Nemania sp. FL0031]